MGKDNYNLDIDEYIICEEDTAYDTTKVLFPLVTIILTNKKLIKLSKSMLGKVKEYNEFELVNIKFINDEPAVYFKREMGNSYLRVLFNDNELKVSMPSSVVGQAWADNILAIVNGDVQDIEYNVSEAGLADQLTDLMSGVGDIFGAFKGKGYSDEKRPTKITIKCDGCGAKVTGSSGKVIRCEYCGTRVSL
ncbi:hypothetical protein [Weissella viridescens]|uniref:hypothetical protein n=1 Tax=Weissella viridescens TaxID=1629 RepID=UPI003AA8F565